MSEPRSRLLVACPAPDGAPPMAPQLLRIVAEAHHGDLPALVGALAQAQAVALARLTTPTPRTKPEQAPAEWITPERAGEIAGVPARRIYDWARGQRWASRPSKRCLRISEPGFRRWLEARSC